MDKDNRGKVDFDRFCEIMHHMNSINWDKLYFKIKNKQKYVKIARQMPKIIK